MRGLAGCDTRGGRGCCRLWPTQEARGERAPQGGAAWGQQEQAQQLDTAISVRPAQPGVNGAGLSGAG